MRAFQQKKLFEIRVKTNGFTAIWRFRGLITCYLIKISEFGQISQYSKKMHQKLWPHAKNQPNWLKNGCFKAIQSYVTFFRFVSHNLQMAISQLVITLRRTKIFVLLNAPCTICIFPIKHKGWEENLRMILSYPNGINWHWIFTKTRYFVYFR